MKTKFAFNEPAYNEVLRHLQQAQEPLIRIGKELADCNIDDFTAIDIEKLIADPRTYLLQWMPPEFVALSKMVAPTSLIWPAEWSDVIALIEASKSNLLANYASYFFYGEGGSLYRSQEKLDEVKEVYTLYAKTEMELERLAFAQEFATLLTKYQSRAWDIQHDRFGVGIDHGTILGRIVEFHPHENTFKIKNHFVTKPKA